MCVSTLIHFIYYHIRQLVPFFSTLGPGVAKLNSPPKTYNPLPYFSETQLLLLHSNESSKHIYNFLHALLTTRNRESQSGVRVLNFCFRESLEVLSTTCTLYDSDQTFLFHWGLFATVAAGCGAAKRKWCHFGRRVVARLRRFGPGISVVRVREKKRPPHNETTRTLVEINGKKTENLDCAKLYKIT